MCDHANTTRPGVDNAFHPTYLAGLDQQDEPPTAGQLTPSRMLRIEELDDGNYALYGLEPEQEDSAEPCVVVAKNEGSFALMTAGVLPLIAGNRSYWMRASQTSEPGLEVCRYGRSIARLLHGDEETLTILNFCDALVRSPECLAAIMEAAGARVLRIVGKILARRLAAWLAAGAAWRR